MVSGAVMASSLKDRAARRRIAKKKRGAEAPRCMPVTQLIVIPVTGLVAPAAVRAFGPAVGDPMVMGAGRHPAARHPDMTLLLPLPVARRPGVAGSRRRHGFVDRRRRRRADRQAEHLGGRRRQRGGRENGGHGHARDSPPPPPALPPSPLLPPP